MTARTSAPVLGLKSGTGLVALFLLLALPAFAQVARPAVDLLGVLDTRLDQLDANKKFRLRIGAGAVLTSRLDDAPNIRAYPLPYLSFDYRNILAIDETQARVNLIDADSTMGRAGFRAGPMVRVDPGRGNVGKSGLPGLGKVPVSLEAGGFVDYSLGPARVRLRVRQDVTEGHNGTVAELDFRSGLYKKGALGLGIQVQSVWGSRNYNNALYGLDARQAAATGLPMFSAGAGFKDVNIGFFGEYKFSERWSAVGAVQYVRLVGDDARSPIAERRGIADRINFGAFVIYTFGNTKGGGKG